MFPNKDVINWCSPEHLSKTKFPLVRNAKGKLNVVDLFCGCGGLSVGVLEAAARLKLQTSIQFAIDFNPQALGVYRRNLEQYSNIISLGDVTTVFNSSSLTGRQTSAEKQLLSSIQQPDVLFAGPPCQGHSDLNNSSRRFDPRNELYLAPIRAALLMLPKGLIIENVPSVVHSSEQVVQRARVALERVGYETEEIFIDFTALGVPQTRKRHLLLASRTNIKSVVAYIQSHVPRSLKLMDYIKDLEQEANSASDAFRRTTKVSSQNAERIAYLFSENIYDLPNHLRPKCHSEKDHSYKSMYGRLRPDTPAQTITSGFGSMGQGRFVHPTQKRMITAHEAARIQGFPDYFDFGGCNEVTALREMIANAVPPSLSFLTVMAFAQAGVLQ